MRKRRSTAKRRNSRSGYKKSTRRSSSRKRKIGSYKPSRGGIRL